MSAKKKTRVARTPDTVYRKADALSFKLLRVPGLAESGSILGVLMMDRWTHRNFEASHDMRFDITFNDRSKMLWRRMRVEVTDYVRPMLGPIGTADVSSEVYCRDDDPFLMSIRYVKDNGRVCYLDDKDTDEHWTGEVEAENKALRQIVHKSAGALPNGAYISPDATVGFMRGLPKEIALVCEDLRELLRDEANRLTDIEGFCKSWAEDTGKADLGQIIGSCQRGRAAIEAVLAKKGK